MVFSVELSKFEANIERDREEEVEDNMSTLFVQLTQVLMSHITALKGLCQLERCALRLCKLRSTVKILLFLTRDFLHVRSEVMQITFNCQNSIVFNA